MDNADSDSTRQPQAGFVVDPGVDIGHVHLKVADIDRALAFYCGVLGFEVMARMGEQAAFLSAGGYHHHIGLNTWESRGGAPPPRGHTGLFHAAIRYPPRQSLAAVLRRLVEAGVPRRSGRERPGALLGSPPGGMAATGGRQRRRGHVHRAA